MSNELKSLAEKFQEEVGTDCDCWRVKATYSEFIAATIDLIREAEDRGARAMRLAASDIAHKMRFDGHRISDAIEALPLPDGYTPAHDVATREMREALYEILSIDWHKLTPENGVAYALQMQDIAAKALQKGGPKP